MLTPTTSQSTAECTVVKLQMLWSSDKTEAMNHWSRCNVSVFNRVCVAAHLPLVLRDVQGVRHFRLRSRRPPSAFPEVVLDQGAERAVLEEARAPRHRGLDYFVANLR